jgi:protein-disulfide isomerase
MKKLVLIVLALWLTAASAPAEQSQYAIKADDGGVMTNFVLAPALQSQLALLPGKVIVGDQNGDVTLVQFYDLNCPYCRLAAGDIDGLIHGDKKLKLVLVPYAVLSVQSVQGALVEMAAAKMLTPDQFFEFHRRIYAGRGVIDGDRALAAAESMGLDAKKIVDIGNTPETLSVLKQSADFGTEAKLIATPDYVIGGVAILGHPGLRSLQKIVAAMRNCGKVVC